MTTTIAPRLDAPTATAPTAPATRAVRQAGRLLPSYGVVALVLAVLVGVVLRFTTTSDLWLDEALSVNIARLSVPDLLAALKVDGSPPLYYLLLHAVIRVAGDGDVAVRALSGVAGVLALPAAFRLGHRLAGRRGAVAALVLLATAPFALRYGSEVRMYSLLLLEVCLGGLALLRALERPTLRRLAPLTLAALALALTHYWALFLLVCVAGGLLAARRWRPLLALVAAGVLFLPQLPTLLYQSAHTGAPWAVPPQPRAVVDTLLAWGGPTGHVLAPLLGLALLLLAAVGALTRPGPDGRLYVVWRGDPAGRRLAGLAVGPLAVAVAVAMLTATGYTVRYTAIALPAYLLLVAVALTRLPRRAFAPVLGLLAAAGLVAGGSDALHQRTQAGAVAAAVASVTRPGDLVVYCPDQLAPAVHRLLPPGRTELSYGDPLGPRRIYWVDYAERNAALDPDELAADYDELAGPGRGIALVVAGGYRTFSDSCTRLADRLAVLRPAGLALARDKDLGESAGVLVYPGTGGLPPTATSTAVGTRPDVGDAVDG